MKLFRAALAAALLCAPACAQVPKPVPGLEKIKHIVVIYLENRSFDNIYGLFPGANGIANAGAAATQVDKEGKPLATLPLVMNTNLKPAIPDTRFPADLPNAPFRIEKYAGIEQTTGDLIHRFYQQQMQINGGKMDKFAILSDAGGLAMSYYDGSRLPLWDYARRFTLMDNFFHAAFGGSFLNHFWLVCACSPKFADAPVHLVAKEHADGTMERDGAVTPDGYAVNTTQPRTGPHNPHIAEQLRLPAQDAPNIGDRLSEKGISWAWYSGGWDDAVAGKPDPLFQFHHQPFTYFSRYALGTALGKAHLKDGLDFLAGIHKGELPAVSFYKPLGSFNEHPGYAPLLAGERYTADILRMIENSPLWNDTLVIVTYDENGGLWDHVAPPKGDRWGPGTRVPTLLVGPHVKKGFIDSTAYDTTAILKLIETRFALEPLASRDAAQGDLTTALDLK